MKVLLFSDFTGVQVKKIEELGYTVYPLRENDLKDHPLRDDYTDCDVMVCYNPFPNINLDKFNDLRFIQLLSVGFNHLPTSKIEEMGLIVSHNVGQTKFQISEWVMTFILNICKNTKYFLANQASHSWKHYYDIWELEGKNVTFLGGGNIACETAKKLKAFGANTLSLNLFTDPLPYMDKVVHIDEIDSILPDSDIIISALPATDETYHLINSEKIAKMKDGCIFVNISRGSVVNESDLSDALKAGKFRGVGLDVFETEPLPQDSPLWDTENVYITPHNAIFSDLYQERIFNMVYDNLKLYIEGHKVENIVDFKRGY